MKYEIHISDLRTYLQCRRKWNWSSPLRGHLEPNIPYAPFFTGRAIHFCLEHFHKNHIPFDAAVEVFLKNELAKMQQEGDLWPTEQEMVDEQIVLIRGLLAHYDMWTKFNKDDRWADDQLEFIDMEISFSAPLRVIGGRASHRVYLAGRYDGLVRRKDDGSYWIWETKTARSIEELQKSLINDNQAGAYMLAAQEYFGVHISGVLYNILKKSVPRDPDVLKNGMLSKNKSIATSPFHYLKCIREHHTDWTEDMIIEEYGDFLETLLAEKEPYFQRVPVYRSAHELKLLSEELYTISLEMVRPSTPVYAAPGWMSCKFCHFKAPCHAMNAGSNYQLILETEFRQRQEWEDYSDEMESLLSHNG